VVETAIANTALDKEEGLWKAVCQLLALPILYSKSIKDMLVGAFMDTKSDDDFFPIYLIVMWNGSSSYVYEKLTS